MQVYGLLVSVPMHGAIACTHWVGGVAPQAPRCRHMQTHLPLQFCMGEGVLVHCPPEGLNAVRVGLAYETLGIN